MLPKLPPITHLVKFRYANTVLVGRYFLCHNIHCDFRKIQICTDTRCRGYTRCFEYIADNSHSKLVSRLLVHIKVVRHVHKNLINRVQNNIFLGNIL